MLPKVRTGCTAVVGVGAIFGDSICFARLAAGNDSGSYGYARVTALTYGACAEAVIDRFQWRYGKAFASMGT